MPRHEFSAKTKALAAERAAGHCERCTAKLYPGKIRYDHDIPDYLGGENTLENCVVACVNCDRPKTAKDIKRIAKAKRNFRSSHGIKKQRTITRWRKFDGTIVIADKNR